MQKVTGSNKKHKVMIYTLSTCGWCKKLKALLRDLDVEYTYADIDLARGDEEKKVREELRKHNPKSSAPTLVLDDGEEVVVGFDEDKVRRLFADG